MINRASFVAMIDSAATMIGDEDPVWSSLAVALRNAIDSHVDMLLGTAGTCCASVVAVPSAPDERATQEAAPRRNRSVAMRLDPEWLALVVDTLRTTNVPLSAATIVSLTELDATSVSRALSALMHTGAVVRHGRKRGSRYGMADGVVARAVSVDAAKSNVDAG